MFLLLCPQPWSHLWDGQQCLRALLASLLVPLWGSGKRFSGLEATFAQLCCPQPSLICEGGDKPAPAPASRAPWAPTSVRVAAVPRGRGAGEGVSRGAGPAAPAAPRRQELAPGAGSRPPMVCCSGRIILGVEFFQITYSGGLNSVCLTFMLTQNFGMQPYLEMTSLQVSPS